MRQMEVKVTFTMPYIKLEIQNDKSQVNFITFFLPLSIPNATENEICHFKVNIMGNKVDYGELPQIIFQPNIFKNTLQVILKTTDE